MKFDRHATHHVTETIQAMLPLNISKATRLVTRSAGFAPNYLPPNYLPPNYLPTP
jgi:hypothetical protein